MKAKIISATLVSIVLFLAGCGRQYTYEFHTGSDGRILWKCNRQTGEVEILETNAPIALFELHNSTDVTPIMFDNQTGQAWRYYRNTDTNGQTTAEGFTRLNYSN
jgi:hypothetical protein